mgnify:CR=1 FL=1
MNVAGDFEGYRNLDDRTLTELRRADAHRRGRKVLDEIEEENARFEEAYERDKAREEGDFVREELQPALDWDLAHEVSYSHANLSAGVRNVPKEDASLALLGRPRPGRFGAGRAMAPTKALEDFDLEIEL